MEQKLICSVFLPLPIFSPCLFFKHYFVFNSYFLLENKADKMYVLL